MTSTAPYWMISIRITDWMLALVAALVVLLVAARLWLWRRGVLRAQRLMAECESLRVQVARCRQKEDEATTARDRYWEFIYRISHDVRQPLQNIQTSLENVATCSPEEVSRWQQYLSLIESEVMRLGRLTDRLRLLSRLEAPDAPVVREPVNLKAVIESVIVNMYEGAEEQGVRILYYGPERPAHVLGDRDHLTEALMNLVDNGIKYSKPGGGEVTISLNESSGRTHIHVADNGLGIPAELLPGIFETAYRAPDPRTRQRKGSGLGLAIVKGIVERHGGQVRVESALGEGTTFSFDLPIYRPL